MGNKFLWGSFVIVGLLVNAAHSGMTGDKKQLSKRQILNADYRLDDFQFENFRFKLRNGHHTASPQVQGDPPTTFDLEQERVALGDLNGDTMKDAAAVLEVYSGGTGSVFELVIFFNAGGKLEQKTHRTLGDRIVIDNMKIEKGSLLVGMRVHGPSDPDCCPSLLKTRRFVIVRDRLVERY